MSKNNRSTRELIGIRAFSHNGISVHRNMEAIFFLVQPSNISVLSDESIGVKIGALMRLLSTQPNIEIICLDARENFETNKRFLDKRIREEDNNKITKLLRADKEFLDNIQLQMSTAREFMFAIKINNGSEQQNFVELNRIEKSISKEGFECRIATRSDIKRFLTRYLGWNVSDDNIEDYDGERSMKKWSLSEEER